MSRRGLVIVALAMIGACSPEEPAAREVCGWRCGPMNDCPNGFACYPDGRCHVAGSSPGRGCTLDGGLSDQPPSIIMAEPGDDESGVRTDTAIRVVFDKPVLGVDTSTMILRHQSVFEPILATVTYHDRTATLVPSSRLEQGTVYVITVAATIKDETGHPYQGRSWEFTTVVDVTRPTLVTRTPAAGASSVGVEDPVIVTFSEAVWGISPTTFSVRDENGAPAGSLALVSSQLARTSGPWRPNTTYSVRLTPEITDLAGNPLVGSPLVSTFTTGPDAVPPRITSRTPENGEVEFPSGAPVFVGFSEPVINYASSIHVEIDGDTVPSTVTYLAGSNTVRVRPDERLKLDATYHVVIEPTLTDTSGNPVVPAVMSWPFRTSAEL